MTEEGATAGPLEPDQAPSWLKALLDHQTQSLQVMLAPVLTHMTGVDSSAPQYLPPAASSGEGGEILRQPLQDRRDEAPLGSLGMPVRPRDQTGGPFAAELEVINRRARSPGLPRRSVNPEPDVRRRDNRETECETSRLWSHHDEQRVRSTVHNSQLALQEAQGPRLATFDGNDDWDSFLLPFERQARKYGWTAAERVDRLHECLRGAAIRYVCSLPERTREDYVLLVEQLTQRFGKKDPPTTVRRKLGELRQGKETSAEFAEEVRRLITLAYPGVDLQLQDQLATDAFLKGLKNQKVAYEVMNRDPCSLAEAQQRVEAHEHNFRATVGREAETKNRARRVSWASDGDAGEDTTATVCRVQTPQYVTTDQFTALTDQVKSLVHTVEKLQLQFERFQSTSSLVERKPNHFQLQPSRMRSQSPSPTRGAVGPCFKCGGSGHLRKDCMRSSSPIGAQNHSDQNIRQQPQSGVSLSPDNQPQRLHIGCTKNKGESLQIPVTVNGVPTQAVIDTGAQTTVISEGLYQSLSTKGPNNLHETYLLNAGVGDGMKAKCGLKVTLKIASLLVTNLCPPRW